MAGFDDWLKVSDPNLFAENIAAQFRLTQAELQKAQEALQPAFALGLQRAMTDPAAWSDLTKAFHAMAPGAASGLPPAKPGEAFMQAIFGSDALTGAVARQASLFAGIAPATLQQMMPGLAMLTMETLVRSTMAGIARNQPAGLASGDYGGATAEMMRRGANAVEALTRPSDQLRPRGAGGDAWPQPGFTTAFTDALASLPWMPKASPPHPATNPATETPDPVLPFATMFDAFARGMQTAFEPKNTAPAASPAPPTPAKTGDGGVDAEKNAGEDNPMGELFRSGQKFQEEYAKEMASLFERYQGAAKAG